MHIEPQHWLPLASLLISEAEFIPGKANVDRRSLMASSGDSCLVSSAADSTENG